MHESNGVVHKLTALFCAKFFRPFDDEHDDEHEAAVATLWRARARYEVQ
jgi:hypothetical protein